MTGWERNLVFEQQVKDFKRVWSGLNPAIALVCLCGNHDVGNRPTKASIEHWTSSFGDDFLSFWANGTFNVSHHIFCVSVFPPSVIIVALNPIRSFV